MPLRQRAKGHDAICDLAGLTGDTSSIAVETVHKGTHTVTCLLDFNTRSLPTRVAIGCESPVNSRYLRYCVHPRDQPSHHGLPYSVTASLDHGRRAGRPSDNEVKRFQGEI